MRPLLNITHRKATPPAPRRAGPSGRAEPSHWLPAESGERTPERAPGDGSDGALLNNWSQPLLLILARIGDPSVRERDRRLLRPLESSSRVNYTHARCTRAAADRKRRGKKNVAAVCGVARFMRADRQAAIRTNDTDTASLERSDSALRNARYGRRIPRFAVMVLSDDAASYLASQSVLAIAQHCAHVGADSAARLRNVLPPSRKNGFAFANAQDAIDAISGLI